MQKANFVNSGVQILIPPKRIRPIVKAAEDWKYEEEETEDDKSSRGGIQCSIFI